MKVMVNNKARERSFLRKRRRSNRIRKILNILRNSKRKKNYKSVTSKKYNKRIESIVIDAKPLFSLIKNPENVIDLIKQIDFHTAKSSSQKNIKINLSYLTIIDIGAITILLAKVNSLSKNKQALIWGTIPDDVNCKKIFDESGFLDYMTDLRGQKFNKNSENFIFKVGQDKTRNEQVGRVIEKAMSFLTGIEQKYPPVYSIIQEICSNSVEWANEHEQDKNWYLGVNYVKTENECYLNFTMADIGIGILKTIERKFSDIFAEGSLKKEPETLKRAFLKKYGSKTGEGNRNKGLPLIQDRYEKNLINRLVVITNNVLLDFENDESSLSLKNNFRGTFYSWTIDQNCITLWNQKKLISYS